MLCFLQHCSLIWFHWIVDCVPTSYNYPSKLQSKSTPRLILESIKRLAFIPKMGHRRFAYYTLYIITPIHSSSKHLRNFIHNISETYTMRKSCPLQLVYLVVIQFYRTFFSCHLIPLNIFQLQQMSYNGHNFLIMILPMINTLLPINTQCSL